MKYMGGKGRIAKHIVPIIQAYIDNLQNCNGYLEPFVGGANVIDKIKCEHKYGSDLNEYLIALLKYVACGGELYNSVSKDLYNSARKCFYENKIGDFEPWQIGCIGFLASYNGRFFDGGYAKPTIEKTKYGEKYRNYYQEAKNNLMNQAPLLKDVDFESMDYREINPSIKNFVIYCDPPYANVKQFKNSTNFNFDEFWDYVRMWSRNNIVLVSELSAPADFECIWEKPVSRSIKATDKSVAVEKLFKYRG